MRDGSGKDGGGVSTTEAAIMLATVGLFGAAFMHYALAYLNGTRGDGE